MLAVRKLTETACKDSLEIYKSQRRRLSIGFDLKPCQACFVMSRGSCHPFTAVAVIDKTKLHVLPFKSTFDLTSER